MPGDGSSDASTPPAGSRPYIPEFDAPAIQAHIRTARKTAARGAVAEPVHRELADPKAEVARLARLDPVDYDRGRVEAAELLGCRVGTLDKEVKRARGEAAGGRGLTIRSPDPAPDPVDGSALGDEIAATARRFLSLPEHAETALALWVLHTHAFEASPISPRLAVTSPEKRCGKTTLLEFVAALAAKPQMASSITAAATFRLLEMARPTLLIDEADTFLKKDNEFCAGC